MSPLTSIQFQ